MRNFLAIVVALIAIAIVFFVIGNRYSSQSKQSQTASKPQLGANLANPASVNCKNHGGTTVIMTNGSGGQYGLCQFEDNMACEEWALFRGNCPVGGVKTTGFDTIEQKYCAWVGGQTLAVTNAQCALPNGSVCSDEELYNLGQCPSK